MKTIFESDAVLKFKNRIENLNNDSQSEWGEMNVSQMLKN